MLRAKVGKLLCNFQLKLSRGFNHFYIPEDLRILLKYAVMSSFNEPIYVLVYQRLCKSDRECHHHFSTLFSLFTVHIKKIYIHL